MEKTATDPRLQQVRNLLDAGEPTLDELARAVGISASHLQRKFTERFGKGPERESPKGMAIWFIESIDGPLVYTVTLNASGISIAEGIKPLKRAVLTTKIAQDFLQDQMVLLKDSKTARVVKPGEKYEFARQSFVCGENEYVMVDESKGVLLIWSRAGIPSVMAVTRELLLQPGG